MATEPQQKNNCDMAMGPKTPKWDPKTVLTTATSQLGYRFWCVFEAKGQQQPLCTEEIHSHRARNPLGFSFDFPCKYQETMVSTMDSKRQPKKCPSRFPAKCQETLWFRPGVFQVDAKAILVSDSTCPVNAKTRDGVSTPW